MQPTRTRQRGVIIILAALLVPVACGFAAIALDAGILWAERMQLQNTADAAALAGASALPGDPGGAQRRAVEYVQRNPVFGRTAQEVTIDLGRWDSRTGFVPDPQNPGSIRVNVGITQELFFAKVLNIQQARVVARATAARGGGIRDISLILDRSGSMQGDLPALKRATTNFVDQLGEKDQASVVTFADEASIDLARADDVNDPDKVKNAINRMVAAGSTNIAAAAADAFRDPDDPGRRPPGWFRRNSTKVAILITDGDPNTFTPIDDRRRTEYRGAPCLPEEELRRCGYDNQGGDESVCRAEALCEAKQLVAMEPDLMLFTVSLRNAISLPSRRLLQEMTELTDNKNDRYFHAADPSDLEEIFGIIARMVPVSLVE